MPKRKILPHQAVDIKPTARADPVCISLLEPDLPALDSLVPYFAQVLESGLYTNFGPMVVGLESRLAQLFYRRDSEQACCVTTASATTAIEIALAAARLPPRATVLLPAFGFPAAAQAVVRLGHLALFAGIDPATWRLTPECADRVAARTQVDAVIPVSSLGYADDAGAWGRIADRHGVAVIIDAAAGIGNQALAPGLMVVSSLHATKALGVGEGGVIATTDPHMAEHMRALTNFGFERRIAAHVGGNGKMSEWHAAIAHAQLDRWETIRARRATTRDLYRRHLAGVPLRLHPDTWSIPVPAYMPIRVPTSACAEALVEALAADSIMARRWFWPALPEHPAFAGIPRWDTDKDPIASAEDLAATLVCLPFHTQLDDRDIERIAAIVRQVVSRHADLR